MIMPQPQDSRRLCGPEETIPVPISSEGSGSDGRSSAVTGVLCSDSTRHDGRSMEAIRPVFVKCGTVAQANGSVFFEVGRTKLVCSVYGPRETTRRRDFQLSGQLNAEIKFAPFACERRRGHQPDSEEATMSRTITQALESAVLLDRFPKAKVDVSVMVLEDGGGVQAAAITAAALALSDASIEMVDLVTGVSVAFNESHMVIDPDIQEEEFVRNDSQWSSLTLALMPTVGEVAAMEQRGATSGGRCVAAVKAACEACHRIHQVQRQCLQDSLEPSEEAKS